MDNKVSFQDGVFVAHFDYHNRQIPKQAGFWFHWEPGSSRCYDGCKACKAGLVKKWWTPFLEKAVMLENYADESALSEIKKYQQNLEASRKADSETEYPHPSGYDYYPFQKAGIDFALNKPAVLWADDMGIGKTIQSLGVINSDNSIQSVLVVCPASLRLNWLREAQRWLVGGWDYYVVESNAPVPQDRNFIIVNYDRLKGDVLKSLMVREWDLLIVDECFPAGTLVDVPGGQIPIENIKEGDIVLGATGPQKVRKINKTFTDSLVRINFKNGKSIVCTPGHPFFTNDGWEFAHNLNQSHYVVSQVEAKGLLNGDMRMVRKGLSSEIKTDEVLREILLSEVENESAEYQSNIKYSRGTKKNSSVQQGKLCTESCQSTGYFDSDEAKQSYEQSRGQRKDVFNSKTNWAQTFGARRQWKRADESREASFDIKRNEVQFCNTYQETKIRVPYSLQNRCCFSINDVGCGSGWEQSLCVGQKKTRQKERQVFKGSWVDCVEVFEQRDFGQLGGSQGTVAVYNLEVEKHPSYSVGGLLVHNCHYAKNPDAKRTQNVLGKPTKWTKSNGAWVEKERRVPGLVDRSKRKFFLTGTPILNRPIELFPLLQAIDPNTWRSRFGYAKRYCAGERTKYGFDDKGSSNEEELQLKLRSSCMIRRLKSEVLTELPPKRRQVVVLPPNGAKKIIKEEQKAWKDHEARLEELRDAVIFSEISEDKAAYEGAVKELKEGVTEAFAQIAKARKRVAVAKVPAAIEHVNNMLESGIDKIIVWAHHHEVLDQLEEKFGHVAIKVDGRTSLRTRDEAVQAFQTVDEVKIIICGIHAMGEGHTLTAGAHAVFVELDFTPAKMQQAEDRAYRIGQSESLLVQHLVFDGTIDVNLANMLVEKQAVIDAALDNKYEAIDIPLVPVVPSSKKARKPFSETEREAIIEAVQMLAGYCDGAKKQDGMGFNRVDTEFGKRLAERSYGRKLTEGELRVGRNFAIKYQGQLPAKLVKVLKPKKTKKK